MLLTVCSNHAFATHSYCAACKRCRVEKVGGIVGIEVVKGIFFGDFTGLSVLILRRLLNLTANTHTGRTPFTAMSK